MKDNRLMYMHLSVCLSYINCFFIFCVDRKETYGQKGQVLIFMHIFVYVDIDAHLSYTKAPRSYRAALFMEKKEHDKCARQANFDI